MQFSDDGIVSYICVTPEAQTGNGYERIDYQSGRIEFWVDGQLHKTNGPAIHWAGGNESYYERGMLHRLDGPAVIRQGGPSEWWVFGRRMFRKDFTLAKIIAMNAQSLFTPVELAKMLQGNV